MNPNAWIANSRDNGRLSIKQGNKIYLDNEQEFKIELFNPLTTSVLAKIFVNNAPISSSGLVLRPGQRFFLDCFVDSKQKFVFNTYDVEDTNSSKEAIKYNGDIRVEFYKETTFTNNWYNTNWYDYYHRTAPYDWNTIPNWYSPIKGDFQPNLTNGITCDVTSYGGTMLLSNTINTSSIETGRIEGGDISSQTFTNVFKEFEDVAVSIISYKLLPNSTKPIETKELLKKFCVECGNKLAANDKFCSACGTKI